MIKYVDARLNSRGKEEETDVALLDSIECEYMKTMIMF